MDKCGEVYAVKTNSTTNLDGAFHKSENKQGYNT